MASQRSRWRPQGAGRRACWAEGAVLHHHGAGRAEGPGQEATASRHPRSGVSCDWDKSCQAPLLGIQGLSRAWPNHSPNMHVHFVDA